MDEITRRSALGLAVTPLLIVADSDGQEKHEDEKKKPVDRDYVIRAGMTNDEADCWELTGKLAGKFFELEKMHPMDAQEVASAIHVIQNKLLSRPTYRKYLEEMKKANK